jgi:polysaccharide export outer membrane protein
MLGRVKRLLALFVLVAVGCGSTLPDYDYAKEPDPRNRELILGVGDVVAINVWENNGLATEATIRPDGTITMPLVGDLKAAGQTPTELKNKIKERLADFVKLQQGGQEITVAVRSWHSYRFSISGEVTRGGLFTSDQYVTVQEALAMAGGLSRFAKRGEIVLIRKDPKTGQTRRIPLDYDLLASGKRLDMNIYVLPGDSIYVP